MRMAGRATVEVAKAPVREWKTTALVATGVAATLLVDDEVASIARRNQRFDRFFETVEPFGGGHSDKVILALALFNDRSRSAAFDAFMSSVLASKILTPAFKAAIDRERPNGDGQSFPSNHATQAFAVATVIDRHYDAPWVYAIATAVGLARIYHDDHWASDVVAGAAIGTFVANTVVSTNQRFRVVPVVDRGRVGVVVALTR